MQHLEQAAANESRITEPQSDQARRYGVAAGMSKVPVARYVLRRKAAHRQQLLALLTLRRSVEPELAVRRLTAPMGLDRTMTRDDLAVIRDLTELVAAIDRRSPQLERSGEAAIVDAARELRVQARARIAELEARARGETAVTHR